LTTLGDIDTAVGGSAMLEFKMRGYPRPSMKWTKDGQPVLAGDRHKFVYPDAESVALIISKVRTCSLPEYDVSK
jgi:Immunoglobulin I-set domain